MPSGVGFAAALGSQPWRPMLMVTNETELASPPPTVDQQLHVAVGKDFRVPRSTPDGEGEATSTPSASRA